VPPDVFPGHMTLRQITARQPAGAPEPPPRLPLVVPSAVVGLLLAGLAVTAFAFGQWPALLAAALAGPILSVVLYRRSIGASLEASRIALTDRLTGLGNDRRFLERLERDLDRAEASGEPLALCVIDVDDFKRINDRFGHPGGDRALVAISASLRHGGEAFRLGGDEFALLLTGLDEDAALRAAEAVLHRVERTECGHGCPLTASAGVAVFPSRGVGRSELVRAADTALYRAKGDGKGCARAFCPELERLPRIRGFEEVSERTALYQAAAGLARAVRARGIDADEGSTVGDLAARVALRLELGPEDVELIRLAGLLTDVGKLALPDELLEKTGPLSHEERRTLERHPQIGYQILGSIGVDPVATWVLHHHERWDGRGYPGRLAGESIPLGARILFVADAFGAMTSDQSWRPRLTPAEAVEELRRCSGTQFDPEVVEAFVDELGLGGVRALPNAATA